MDTRRTAAPLVVYRGKRLAIAFARRPSGRMPVRDYMESLDGQAQEQVEAWIRPVLRRLADVSAWHNEERVEALGEGLFKLKHRGSMHRFVFFYDSAMIVLTHGFTKRGRKWRREEIARAEEIRKEYWTWARS